MKRLLALLCLLPFPAAGAETPESAVYTVADVAVDVTDNSAAHARTKAIPQAQRQALGQLMERFDVDPAVIATLSDNDLFTLVKSFDVQSEKTSPVRYLGTYTVQFRPTAVRDYLTKKKSAFTDTMGKPVLVLPILKGDGPPILWQQPTKWRAVWEETEKNSDLVPVIVPKGNLTDVSSIDADGALQGKADSLIKLAQNYNVGGTVVAVLNADLTKAGTDYTVDITHWDSQNTAEPSPVHLHLPAPNDPAAIDATLRQAVHLVREQIEKDWKQSLKAPPPISAATLPAPPKNNTTPTPSFANAPDLHLPVAVPVSTPQAWAQIARRLSAINGIVQTNVINLARGNVAIEIEYRGTVADLQAALSRDNLVLFQDKINGGWVLKPNS